MNFTINGGNENDDNSIKGAADVEETETFAYAIDFDAPKAEITINGAIPTIGKVTLDEATVNVDGTNGGTVKATAKSAKDTDITESVDWTVLPSKDITVEKDGTITVGAKAKDGRYTVTAAAVSGKSQGTAQTAEFTVTRDAAVATSIEVYRGETKLVDSDTVIIPTIDTPNKYTYTAKVLNQYGDVMEDAEATLAMTGDLAGKYSDGKITMSKTDTELKDKTGKLTASYTGLDDVVITITAKDIEITAPTVTTKTNPTYGDTWAQIVSFTGGSASLNGKKVAGTFYLKTEGSPDAGENKAFEIYFQSDDKAYDVQAYAGTVNVAKKAVTVTADSATKVYDGTALTKNTFTNTALVSGHKITATVSGTITNVGAENNVPSAAVIKAGEKDVTENYNVTYVNGKLTVTAKSISGVTVEGLAANGYEYTGKAQEPAVTVRDGSATLVKDTDYTVAYKNNTNYGTATITITGKGNYKDTKDVTFRITKTQPKSTDYTVTLPTSGPYTGTAKTAAATKNTAAIGDITVKYNGSTTAPKDAGTYEVTIDIAESANYAAMTGVNCGTFTIEKAPLTITGATVAEKTYNNKTDDAKVTAVTFGGLVNGETLALGTDYTATGMYTSADASDAAAVTVSVKFNDTAKLKNYEQPTTLTVATTGKVNKATTTLSLEAADATYTGLAYDTAKITKTSNVATEPIYTWYADNNGAKGAALDAVPVNAGTYWVEGSIEATTNNTAVTSAAVKFTVEKAPLTITAKDKTITYGAAPANDGVTYAGFVNGETEAKVTGLTYAYTYEQYGNVGDYAINLSGATADNYAITTVPGKLTVGQKEVSLTWTGDGANYYTGKPAAVTATATGLENNDEITVTVSGGAQTEVGSYTAAAAALAGTKAANYKLPESKTAAYTIAYALENVTATPETVTATVDQKNFTITVVGYRGTDESVVLSDKSGTLTVEDGKVTVHGVEYTVDASGVVLNETDATLTKDTEVEKAESADNTITEDILDAISVPATTSDGLDAAAAEAVLAEAAKNETITEIVVTMSIQPKSYSGTSLKLEIHPEVTYKDENGAVVSTGNLANSAIKAPVTISVNLPGALATVTHLVAKHTKTGGGVEYLAVTVAGGVATWKQSSFSEVELIADTPATVSFTFEDGHGESINYSKADIGKALPSDSKSGNTFNGWKFYDTSNNEIGTGPYKTLTEELLTELNKNADIAATPNFTVITSSGSGGGGGSVTSVSVPSTSGGRVYVNNSNARKGDTVTITATPNIGKTVDTVTVTDANGRAVSVTDIGGNKYTFVMPSGKVTVKVTFVDEPAEPTEPAESAFTDVEAGAYYEDAVDWAVANGITTGTSATTFSPNASCTRAQMVTFLWRLAGSPRAEGANPFGDVAADAYYYDAVIWAVENGITTGTAADAFSPDATVSRAQSVTFLYRYAGTPEATEAASFDDVAADAYYADAVAWAAANGITTGTSATTFSPDNACVRAQIVTFMYRYDGLNK